MKFSPGQQVIVLDTTHKPAGSATIVVYHPETHQYTVLYQYPGSPEPEQIPLPEYRLVSMPTAPHTNAAADQTASSH